MDKLRLFATMMENLNVYYNVLTFLSATLQVEKLSSDRSVCVQ